MTFFKKLIVAISLSIAVCLPTFAQTFIIRHVQIIGLQRYNEGTVLSYIPVHVGQRYTDEVGDAIIESLYRTDFFSNVRVGRRGSTLIVRVHEQPTIGWIEIHGNKTIPKKKLDAVLKRLGISVGSTFNPAVLKEITQGLQQEYNNLGRTNATVFANIKQRSRNRVAVEIQVVEGKSTVVRAIHFIGAHHFSGRTLREQMKTRTRGIFSWYTHNDRYSASQLDMDMQSLQNFYLDHGYMRFQVLSKDVTFSPNHKYVDITITIHEGPIYHVASTHVLPPYSHNPDILHIVHENIHVGAHFSRSDVMFTDKLLMEHFANAGYAFPTIQVRPYVNDNLRTVVLNFYMRKGSRTYVNQIDFVGNNRTIDRALRNELLQMEDSVYNYKRVQISKQRLALLPYLTNVMVTPVAVPGHPDLVNLNYHVKEINAGKISAQGGYATDEGIIYGASISEPNFMGTGRYVSIGFQNSQYSQNYSIAYNNPFYTVNGISKGFQLYYTRTDPDKNVTNIDPFTMNDFGGAVTYGIPTSNFSQITLGYGYDYIEINNVQGVVAAKKGATNFPEPASPLVLQFTAANKSPFSEFNLTAGWNIVTLDRAVFPTAGGSAGVNFTFGVPLINRSVGFYKGTFNAKYYCYLGHGFVLEPNTTVGIGGGFGSGINRSLPFYNNFYAGGIGSLPGFAPNSLGPVNPNSGNYIGGNLQLLGGVNFIFPNGISDRIRTAIFLDAGNVFETYHAFYTAAQLAANPNLKQMFYEKVSLNNMRVAAGLLVSWYSPLGPIEFSLGIPIVKKKGDDTEVFGFTFGTGF